MIKYYALYILVFLLPGAITSPRPVDLYSYHIRYIKELVLLSKAINSESTGEKYIDKLRVGSVMLNRIKSNDFPNTLDSVIFQPNQFKGITSVHFKIDTTEAFKESLKAAIYLMIHGSILPPNIVYFHNPKTSKDKNWIKKMKPKLYIKGDRHWYFTK